MAGPQVRCRMSPEPVLAADALQLAVLLCPSASQLRARFDPQTPHDVLAPAASLARLQLLSAVCVSSGQRSHLDFSDVAALLERHGEHLRTLELKVRHWQGTAHFKYTAGNTRRFSVRSPRIMTLFLSVMAFIFYTFFAGCQPDRTARRPQRPPSPREPQGRGRGGGGGVGSEKGRKWPIRVGGPVRARGGAGPGQPSR